MVVGYYSSAEYRYGRELRALQAVTCSRCSDVRRIRTTDKVLAEFPTLFSNRLGLRRRAVGTFRELARDPNVRILSQSRESFHAGFDLYAARPDEGYTLTDSRRPSTLLALPLLRPFEGGGYSFPKIVVRPGNGGTGENENRRRLDQLEDVFPLRAALQLWPTRQGFRTIHTQLRRARPQQVITLQVFYSLLFSLIGFVLATPLRLITAVGVKLTSKGPVLYRQRRVGLNGRVFTVYKFRSMYVDAEARTGAVWASKDDPRITPFGKWLRKLRLDELPQLWNVLKGDMSMVGPRPECPEFVEMLAQQIPYYRQRLAVKAGDYGLGAD